MEKVRQNAALLCVCTIGIGCVLALAASLFLDELLQLLHAKGRILPYARGYLSMLLLFTPFCMLVLYQRALAVPDVRRWAHGAGNSCAGESMLFWMSSLWLAFLWELKAGAPWQNGIGYMVPAVYGTLFFLQRKQKELYFHDRFGY
ncbi:MAG: MATE family efflux transporter [[Clostridium] innocuum]